MFQGKEASMGLAGGIQPLAFGHSTDAAVDIEGLSVSDLKSYHVLIINPTQLLEDHLQKLREEETGEGEDNEMVWENWDVESDYSEGSGSESEGWVDVDGRSDELQISDSEDENEQMESDEKADGVGAPARLSTLATTKASSTTCHSVNS